MEEYQWDGSLATGHALIDEQHQQLFAAINGLLATCRAGKGKEELSKSLDFLTNYTIKHFFEEEQIQQKYQYPEYPNHKQYHDGFKTTIRDLTVRLIMKGASDELITEVHEKVGDWLVSHIKVHDFRLAKFIKEKDAAAG
ncbi:MAG: hemerythrin family protein [Treponema sp.]|jgi:hemerythrin|nr:hemerythrin family protein [Treponema sp.]